MFSVGNVLYHPKFRWIAKIVGHNESSGHSVLQFASGGRQCFSDSFIKGLGWLLDNTKPWKDVRREREYVNEANFVE